MAQKLRGRRILLTGISRGIGLAIARRFLPEGAEILGISRDPERLAKVERELESLAPGRLTTLAVDLEERGSEEPIARAVAERWGALDILFNNAAVMLDPEAATGLLTQPPGILERSLDINLWAPFRVTRALLPALERGREPRVIHTSSGAGSFAAMRETSIASYRLSKWALKWSHHADGRRAGTENRGQCVRPGLGEDRPRRAPCPRQPRRERRGSPGLGHRALRRERKVLERWPGRFPTSASRGARGFPELEARLPLRQSETRDPGVTLIP